MIILLNEEMKSFEDLASSFASKELSPHREESDRFPFAPFNNDILAKAHGVGFLCITLSEDLGGIGQGISALCVILECLCRMDASLGSIIFTSTLSQEIIIRAGREDVLRNITSSAGGPKDLLIAFPAYSNPSEHSSLPLATKGKNGHMLSGSVNYLVLAGIASRALIPARISGQDGYSFFLVDLSDAKVKISDPIFSLGIHACPVADVKLNNAEATLIGNEGEGKTYFEDASNMMNAAAAAMSLGIMRGAFEDALAYCNEREQGGWAIVNWSEMKMILADMAIKMNIANMAVSEACHAIEKKTYGWNVCAKAAALHVQESACHVTTDGIQVLGGYGYMKDYGQEKRFRDAQQMKTLLGSSPMRKIEFIDQLNVEG
jgi:alkylation response protein AidB-like acyl-CoA dehydrogenase